MTGGERVAAALVRHGVRTLFTLPGGHISPIFVAAKANGIRVVDVRDEANAVFAADATGRLSGIVGVAVVTAGPGLTNALTPLRNALMARSPLLLLCGATATVLRGRGSLQDIDQVAAVRSHVKWVARVDRADRLVPMVDAAIARALQAPCGPVALECPVDLLYDRQLVREMYGVTRSLEPGAPLSARLERWYLERHLRRTLGRETDRLPGVRSPVVARQPRRPPSSRDIVRAVALLESSARPVLLVGSQAMEAPAEAAQLATAAGKLGVPTWLGGMARGLLGRTHPLQLRHHRKDALREADLVILAGTPMDFRLEYGRHIGRQTKIVTANADASLLGFNRKPTLGVHADADLFVRSLADGARRSSCAPWLERLQARDAARDAEIAERAAEDIRPINPIALCRAVDDALSDDSVIVADGGDFVGTASYVVRPRAPLSWLDPGAFGTLGVGAGFAMAAKILRPDSDVWLLYGDGAAGFSIMEFDTMVRHRIPVIAVVGNDGAWAQIMRDQVPMLGDDVGTVLGRTAYHDIANALGARGFLLDRPEAIGETLAAARDCARAGTPVLVNAHIGLSDFRKGSISL